MKVKNNSTIDFIKLMLTVAAVWTAVFMNEVAQRGNKIDKRLTVTTNQKLAADHLPRFLEDAR